MLKLGVSASGGVGVPSAGVGVSELFSSLSSSEIKGLSRSALLNLPCGEGPETAPVMPPMKVPPTAPAAIAWI